MTDSKEIRLARLEGAIEADPSVPSFFAEAHWQQVRQDIVARGREQEFLEECRALYGDGDQTNGDHSRDDPPGYGNVPDEPFDQ